MRKIIIISTLFSIVSCQFFEQRKVPDENQIYYQKLKAINWKTVDRLPAVANCEKISDKNEQKKCFFEFVTNTISQRINVDSLSKVYPNKQFMLLKVCVVPNYPIKFETVIKDSLEFDKEKIDSMLLKKLADFPKIYPAIKQGIPVKTEFAIRIELKE